MKQELTIRPRPIKGEALYGYLLRLASWNGLKDVRELLSDVEYPGRQTFITPSKGKLVELAEAIGPHIRFPATSFISAFSEQTTIGKTYGERRLIAEIRLQQPRICTQCFQDESEQYFRFDWSLLPHSHCKHHDVDLIDACPCCGESLNWSKTVFKGCPNCGISWKDVPISRSSSIGWQQEFEELKDSPKPLESFLDLFAQKFMQAARPNDQIYDRIQRLPSTFCHVTLALEQSWLLHSDSISRDQIEERVPEGLVSSNRMKYPDTLHYHVKYSKIVEMLGLPSRAISQLVDNSILTPLNSSKIGSNMIFDKRQADNLLKQIQIASSVDRNSIILNPGHPLFELFGTNYYSFLTRAISNPNLFRTSDGLSTVQMAKDHVYEILSELLDKNLNGKFIPKNVAKGILAINDQVFLKMVYREQIEIENEKTTSQSASTQSIKTILNKPHLVNTRQELVNSYL